jgi:hypothetical protein
MILDMRGRVTLHTLKVKVAYNEFFAPDARILGDAGK